jgi:hypothetical protein
MWIAAVEGSRKMKPENPPPVRQQLVTPDARP